jgi:hypothetical protein
MEQQQPPKPMRLAMPTVAAFVDGLRAAFGADEVDGWIRDGLKRRSGAGFYASEAGAQIGQRVQAQGARHGAGG